MNIFLRGPISFTPPLIKNIMQLTLFTTLISIIFDSLFSLPPGFSFVELFTLNQQAFTHYYIWQPLSSLFLLPSPSLSFSFLFDLLFMMLILFMFGSQVYEYMGKRRFIVLYFGASIVSGLFGIATMYFGHQYAAISTLAPALLAITTVWTLCSPSQELLLFFLLPLQPKWFLSIALLGTVGANLLQGNYALSSAYFGAFLFSYLLSIMAWHLKGPYERLWRVEAFLKRLSFRMQSVMQWKILKRFYRNSP
jgi:membrane associated rhomboid family serine protease